MPAPHSLYPNARALSALGLRVDWPLAERSTTVKPGSRLVVTVARTDAAGADEVAKLTYVRVDAEGDVLRTLASERLRHGRFSVRVPHVHGAHYALTLAVADLRYRSSFVATPTSALPIAPTPSGSATGGVTTPVAGTQTGVTGATSGVSGAAPAPTATATSPPTATSPSATTSSTPTPSTGPTNLSPCVPGGSVYANAANETFAATLAASATSAAAGGSVPYTLQNSGTGCLSAGAAYGWQLQGSDGTWSNVPLNGVAFPTIAYFLAPGQVNNGAAVLPKTYSAGVYRLEVVVLAEQNAAPAITLFSGPVTVAATS